MKTIAYLRVSKNSQDVGNQRLAILEFARQEKFEVSRLHGTQHVVEALAQSTTDRPLDGAAGAGRHPRCQ